MQSSNELSGFMNDAKILFQANGGVDEGVVSSVSEQSEEESESDSGDSDASGDSGASGVGGPAAHFHRQQVSTQAMLSVPVICGPVLRGCGVITGERLDALAWVRR